MNKKLMGLALMLIMASSLFGFGASEEETKEETTGGLWLDSKEAPELAAMVANGSLPPLEERIPQGDNAFIEEADEIGDYGGIWDQVWGGMDSKWTVGNIAAEALFDFTPDGEEIYPMVAKGYEVNEDSTVYTVYLREGLRWSDGELFTSEDVSFYYEHMLKPETFGKALYNCYYSTDPETGERTPAELVVIDDYTFEYRFKDPSPIFLRKLVVDNRWAFAPAHFYKTILPEFVGEEEALVIAKEKGFNDIDGLGQWYGYYYWVWADRPTLRPWVAVNHPNDEFFVMERNPYYYKTDAEGNQLPYMDELRFKRVEDPNQYVLEAIAGNIDMQAFTLNDFTILKENERAGNYNLIMYQNSSLVGSSIQFNLAVEDLRFREVFADIRFREAISVAIDRNVVSEMISGGLSEPTQFAPPEGFPGHDPEWSKQWTEYDPARANKLLDDMGLEMGSDGYRNFSDGTDFMIPFEHSDATSAGAAFGELVVKYLGEVGIECVVRMIDNTLLSTKIYANELVAMASTEAGSTSLQAMDIMLRPEVYIPNRPLVAWNSAFGDYVGTDGENGVAPYGPIKEIVDLYTIANTKTSEAEMRAVYDEILDVHKENQLLLGFTEAGPPIFLANKNIRNLPENAIFCDEFRSLTTLKLSKVFFENGED